MLARVHSFFINIGWILRQRITKTSLLLPHIKKLYSMRTSRFTRAARNPLFHHRFLEDAPSMKQL
jgi:hypothetical protein